MNKAKGLGFNEEFCSVYENTKKEIMKTDNMNEKEFENMFEKGIKEIRNNKMGLTEKELCVYMLATCIASISVVEEMI